MGLLWEVEPRRESTEDVSATEIAYESIADAGFIAEGLARTIESCEKCEQESIEGLLVRQ